VDNCDWSTASAQFLWDAELYAKTGQLRNLLSGECLGPAAGLEVYAGPLVGGKHTAVLFNRSPAVANVTLDFSSLWSTPAELAGVRRIRDSQVRAPTSELIHEALPVGAARTLSVRDVWARRDLGQFTGSVTMEVRSHAVAHLVLSQP